MKKRTPNETIVICKRTKKEFKIVDAIETNNQFYQGVYLYRFEGHLDTGFGLYRKEFIVKGEEDFRSKYTPTFVISAFPGCGKSYCYKNYQDKFSMLDSDSSEFSWVKDSEGNNTKERNPDFPNNYIKHIKENLNKVNVIFVSSHEIVRKALAENNIKTIIVYPNKSLKDEWIRRFEGRGNDQSFISFISKNWDNFIDDIESEDYGFIKQKLNNENNYIDLKFLYELHDNSMGNLTCLWANS